jgi:hypothetical protein
MRLLGLAPADIAQELKTMEQDSKAIQKMIFQIGWYMRGFLSYEEAWGLSPQARDFCMKLINDNVERVKKTGMPLL